MKSKKSKYCPFCKTRKTINKFYNASATYCRECAIIYNAEYSQAVRTQRVNAPKCLTDKEMSIEMRGYKKLSQSGVSAMSQYEKQFEKLCSQNGK